MLLLVVGASIALSWFLMNLNELHNLTQETSDLGELITTEDPRWYLPGSTTDELSFKDHYTLSYHEKYEQAEWVAYRLTRSSLKLPDVDRTDWFESDPDIRSGSAHYKDYSGSGLTRGHLVPAADMAFDENAMEETFFMSNISPQERSFNGGVWRELEELVRDWAWDRSALVVITGPVLTPNLARSIGENQIAVPEMFYKIVFDEAESEIIAFLIPNKKSERHLKDYVVNVDSLEKVTGIDFFEQSLNMDMEELESFVDPDLWDFNEEKYRLRIGKWNNQ